MTTDESALPGLLQRMVRDIEDPQCGYWLYANYFDIISPTERTTTRWWQAPLYLDYNAIWNPVLEANAIVADVILTDKQPAEYERIRIEYAQVWLLKRFHHQEKPQSADEWILYNDSAKLKMPPTEKED